MAVWDSTTMGYLHHLALKFSNGFGLLSSGMNESINHWNITIGDNLLVLSPHFPAWILDAGDRLRK